MKISSPVLSKHLWICLPLALLCWVCKAYQDDAIMDKPVMKALILDGQNNHYIWPKTTQMMKTYLEDTGLFKVDILRTRSVVPGIKYNPHRNYRLDQYLWEFPYGEEKTQRLSDIPTQDPSYSPDFEQYDLIVSNLGADAASWPQQTRLAFENYINNGGGLVVVHAANNAFGDWEEYNRMIGLGAWGGRDASSGPYVYLNDQEELIRNSAAGTCGSHGPEQDFVVTTRAPEHPIMKGLPQKWLHARDELYDRMRGPAENMTILATAYSDLEKNDPPWDPTVRGSARNEPMLIAVQYGKGRIFHSALGHFDYSQECVGFITTFQRGAEWAASGQVTQKTPKDFPTLNQTRSRKWVAQGEVGEIQQARIRQNPYQNWITQLRDTEVNAELSYTQDAILITEPWKVQEGLLNINTYWEKAGITIDSIWTRHYTFPNKSGAYAYEIGGFKSADQQLYGSLIIWDIRQQPKRRVFEFTTQAQDISWDKDPLEHRRQQWMDYCNDHQIEKLVEELYSLNALYYNHRPIIKGREALLSEYSYMKNPAYQLTLTPQILQPFREDLAVEIGQCSGGYNGKYILIWVKNDQGEWEIALDSNI